VPSFKALLAWQTRCARRTVVLLLDGAKALLLPTRSLSLLPVGACSAHALKHVPMATMFAQSVHCARIQEEKNVDGGGYDIFLRALIEYKLNQTHAHYIPCKARPKQFH
jgi:hypothetical protein